ncbi:MULTISPECIES: DUF6274 family protein [unclassified Streptomyces]|uniref:DUF6274 family protein n=1 Tax=unclassified Streptomyces TaxID=2593676 RepID=UPI00081D3B07|nr:MULTISPECIES: DUF6274 family protein [unclassified Streptomyces]MYZ38501.1 hypothetical protein [Streptomyces sp. SID4917]SCF98903.1 hypothetical protein GA0115259_106472 [Streptomyces sp. MnatMP-M17]
MSSTARHETRALLRAHLAAASGHPHRTGHCPICHRLQRLAMEPTAADDGFADGFFEDELPDDLTPSAP